MPKKGKEFLMNTKFSVLFLLVSSAALGCFRHQEAPDRPVTATSAEEAVAQSEATSRVILNGVALDAVPQVLSAMPKLDTLYLRAAKISDLSGLSSLTGLREIDLSEIKLGTAPESLAQLSELRRLYLSDCGITNFPVFTAGLVSLEYLNLDRNAIASLPDSLPTSLRWLRLNSNKLVVLPESIGTLSRLQRLYLENNRLTGLPDSLVQLKELEDINLSGNSLNEFPAVLTQLPKLRNLNLQGNEAITSLPADLSAFSSLRSLILTRCRLSVEECDRIRAALPECVIIF